MKDSKEPISIFRHNGELYLQQHKELEAQLAAGAGVLTPIICPTCQAPRGLDLVYPLATAADLIPMASVNALKVWLSENSEHVSPPIYRKYGARWHRYLSTTDICKIRERIFHPFARGRGPSTVKGKLMRIAIAPDPEQKREMQMEAIERNYRLQVGD